MSKIGSAFGGGGAKSNPSTTEIFLALAEKARADEASAKSDKLGGPGLNASLTKFEKGRKVKARRLKGGRIGVGGPGGAAGDEESASINRPGARTATLLGN